MQHRSLAWNHLRNAQSWCEIWKNASTNPFQVTQQALGGFPHVSATPTEFSLGQEHLKTFLLLWNIPILTEAHKFSYLNSFNTHYLNSFNTLGCSAQPAPATSEKMNTKAMLQAVYGTCA